MDRIDAMRLFVRLAERQSFSAAARDLRIKQSTASKWIAELEQQLSVALVDRTTRSLRLTEAGRRFHEGAARVLAAFDALSTEISEQSAEPMGKVRLSVPVVCGRLFVTPLLTQFLARHPRIEAELVLCDRYVILSKKALIWPSVEVRFSSRKVQSRRSHEEKKSMVGGKCYNDGHRFGAL